MHEHVFTCYVFLSNPQCFVEQMRLRLASFYEYTIEQGSERTFIFTDGYAAARAVDGGLLMRIGAANLVSSHAIRIAFEVSLLQILQSAPKIAWYPARLGASYHGSERATKQSRLIDGESTQALTLRQP